MATDEEIQNALLAIHSRLGTIEGKVNLVARADRERILEVLGETVRKDPLIGQIYLVLDGKRTQNTSKTRSLRLASTRASRRSHVGCPTWRLSTVSPIS